MYQMQYVITHLKELKNGYYKKLQKVKIQTETLRLKLVRLLLKDYIPDIYIQSTNIFIRMIFTHGTLNTKTWFLYENGNNYTIRVSGISNNNWK